MNNPNDIFKIEVHELNSSSRVRVGQGIKVVDKTVEQLDQALDVAKRVAGQAAQQLGAMGHRPDEMQLKLGLKFTAEAGAIIAKTATEGNIEITLTWRGLSDPS